MSFSHPTADFGFARHLRTNMMAGTLCGSPLYMVSISVTKSGDEGCVCEENGPRFSTCILGATPRIECLEYQPRPHGVNYLFHYLVLIYRSGNSRRCLCIAFVCERGLGPTSCSINLPSLSFKLCLSAHRLLRSSCLSSTMPKLICGVSARLCISV